MWRTCTLCDLRVMQSNCHETQVLDFLAQLQKKTWKSNKTLKDNLKKDRGFFSKAPPAHARPARADHEVRQLRHGRALEG